MEMVNLEEQVYPVKKADKFDVQDFIKNELEEMYTFMKDNKLPFLHCVQVGINKDIFIWRRANKQPNLVINPRVIVKDKKAIRYVPERSFSHPNKETGFNTYATIRAVKILGLYDNYTDKGGLTADSDEFKDAEAGAFQQMADLSKGKLITRFPIVEVTNETDEETTVEGSDAETEKAV